MTPPRYIVENQLVFVTCEAIGRSFRFVPTHGVAELLWYLLAVMAQRCSIRIHEVCFMSNHFHVLLTDCNGVLPDFMRDFNSLVSRGLNALRGSTGGNVENGYNIVIPSDGVKVVEHAVYTLANPCAAHLVERAAQWKGVSSLGLEYGTSVELKRPREGLWKTVADALLGRKREAKSTSDASEGRARRKGRTKLPETVELTLVRPPVMLELTDTELRDHIRAEVRRTEDELISERRATARDVVGMSRVLLQSYTDTPETTRVLFDTTPRGSGRNRWARMQTLARLSAFQRAHAIARDAIAEVLAQASALGRHLAERLAAIEIPHGAFLLRRRYGCIRGPAV